MELSKGDGDQLLLRVNEKRHVQQQVATILREVGLEVSIEKEVQTVRGTVNIDVYAEDPDQTPKTIYLCECKHWL